MEKLSYLILFLAFIGCQNPMDKAYTKATFQSDLEAINKSESIDTSEAQMMAGYLMLSEFQKKNLEGKTYNQILTEAKMFKKEQEEEERKQKELAEKAKREEEARIKKLQESVRVTIFEKSFVKGDWEDGFRFKFAIENLTDKEMRAFNGKITITDLFDKPLKSLNFTYDDPIKANANVKQTLYYDYNQFVNNDGLLKEKDLDDLKITWEPAKIIFKDGTTLE